MNIYDKMDVHEKWLSNLHDGEPCDHVGCLHHVSHPCEVCGRIAGRMAVFCFGGSMKEIPLTQGKVAIVDDEDFEWLNQWKWFYQNSGYAARGEGPTKIRKYRLILMHREICKTPKGMQTDHVNHNRLDNRKENLRICTQSGNSINTIRDNHGEPRGVECVFGSWRATISINKKRIHTKGFKTMEEAGRAYDELAKKYHGEFAILNFPSEAI